MKGKLNILMVTPRIVEEAQGGAEYHAWGLAKALADRGHRVEIYTTCTGQLAMASPGYVIWGNHFVPGREEAEGVLVNRFPVRNPRPLQARKARARVDGRMRKECGEPSFARHLARLLEPGQAVLVHGWHGLESWRDGPARWSAARATIALRGEGMTRVALRLFSPRRQTVKVGDGGGWICRARLQANEEDEVLVEVPGRDFLALRLESGRAFRQGMDERELGVALRGIRMLHEPGEVSVGPASDLERFLDNGAEEAVFELLTAVAEGRPEPYQRDHDLLVGPDSPALREALMREAPRFDLVIATHTPHTTLTMGCEAAHQAGVPCVALPLFHLRDRYVYWPDTLRRLREADRIDSGTPTLANILGRLGAPAFASGVGLDPEEFGYPESAALLREKYALGDGPLLLWVGRKNRRKGYPEAAQAVRLLRERGLEVGLLMVGPEEDGRPAGGGETLYLGALPREELLQAYHACRLFVLPSRDESFGISVCEAWLAGKPVLAWRMCSAARDLVDEGRDGFLCSSAEELADAAEKLLRDPALAERMGRRGREKVLGRYLWSMVAELFEEEVVKTLKGGPQAGLA